MKATPPDLSTAVWRKSTYSNGGDANCVEVSDQFPGLTPVRDSKTPEGPALLFRDTNWGVFIDALKAATL